MQKNTRWQYCIKTQGLANCSDLKQHQKPTYEVLALPLWEEHISILTQSSEPTDVLFPDSLKNFSVSLLKSKACLKLKIISFVDLNEVQTMQPSSKNQVKQINTRQHKQGLPDVLESPCLSSRSIDLKPDENQRSYRSIKVLSSTTIFS